MTENKSSNIKKKTLNKVQAEEIKQKMSQRLIIEIDDSLEIDDQ